MVTFALEPVPSAVVAEPERPPGRFVHPVAYPLAGLGVVALGSFAVFGLQGRADAADLRAGCGATASCTDDQVGAVRSKYLIADISLGVGIVALGAATLVYVLTHR